MMRRSDPDCLRHMSLLCSDSPVFQWSFYSRDLYKNEETMPKVKTVFHSMAPLK